jgi:autotransporter translocation and assembly factor TamB
MIRRPSRLPRRLLRGALPVAALLLSPPAALHAAEDEKSWLVNWVEKTISTPDFRVSLDRIDGVLSADMRVGAVTIADRRGVWLTINDARLVWTRGDLMSGKLTVERLEAASIDVARAPDPPPATAAKKPPAPAASEPFVWPQLPVAVTIGALQTPIIRLPADIAGEDMALSAKAGGALDSQGFRVKADVRRIADPKTGGAPPPAAAFLFDAGYAAADGRLTLDLDYREPAGGLAARMLNLPGRPPLAMTVKGAGPLTDFAADIDLQADGRRLVNGRAGLARKADHYALTADVAGSLESLAYGGGLDFLRGRSSITLAATLPAGGQGGGGYTLDRLGLTSGVLTLNAAGVFADDFFPTVLKIDGALTPADGRGLALPGGDGATLGGARFKADFGDGDWRADVVVDRLRAGGLSVGKTAFVGQGRARDLSDPAKRASSFALDGRVDNVAGNGLDRALKGGVGAKLRGDWQAGGPIRIAEALLTPGAAKARFAGTINDGAADGHWTLDSGDLNAFKDLVGLPLDGRASLTADGNIAPATGAFAFTFAGVGDTLGVSIGENRHRLPGKTTLAGRLTRDAGGLKIKDLKLAGRKLQATADGAVTPTGADLKAMLRLDDLSALTDPKIGLTGGVSADVHITGPLDAPTARYALRGSRLSVAALREAVLGEGGRAAPPWTLTAEGAATLQTVAVKAGLTDGATRIAVDGRIPLDDGKLALKLDASPSLALVNALLRERGAKLTGKAVLSADIGGTLARPDIRGRLTLADGTFNDPETGMRLSALNGLIRLEGTRATVERLSAVTGRSGTVALGGTLALQPVPAADLTLTLDNARFVYGALAQMETGGKITLRGPLSRPDIAGTVTIQRAELTVPDRIPGASVTGPAVRHVGASPAVRRAAAAVDKPAKQTPAKAAATAKSAAAPAAFDAGLDVTIASPGKFFVRGRGLEAELAGSLTLKGLLSEPRPTGGFRLRRGTLDIVGRRIDFDEGRVTLTGDFNPTIDFRASSRRSDLTVTAAVSGAASDPQLVLSSTPTLPQDEILAQFLFGRSIADLSPLQLAQMAAAAAQLAGGPGGGDLLASIRKGAGLDSLGATTDAAGNMALQAGRYIGDNLYLGVTTGAKGETNATLNLDITPELKVKVGGGADSNLSGVVYEVEY